MSKMNIWLIAGSLASILATPVRATPVGVVVGLCDQMYERHEVCNYSIQGNSLVGCTNTGTFNCPIDAKRECTGAPLPEGATCTDNGTIRALHVLSGTDLLNTLQKNTQKK
jgi:hypothetical protein